MMACSRGTFVCANIAGDTSLTQRSELHVKSRGAQEYYPEVLVLYLERPRHNDAQSDDLGWGASDTTT